MLTATLYSNHFLILRSIVFYGKISNCWFNSRPFNPLFNWFHNVEHIILTKYKRRPLNQELTHNGTKIKMDESQQTAILYKALSKSKFLETLGVFSHNISSVFLRKVCGDAPPLQKLKFIHCWAWPYWLAYLIESWPEGHRFLNSLGLAK
jgi:hypothetical protein